MTQMSEGYVSTHGGTRSSGVEREYYPLWGQTGYLQSIYCGQCGCLPQYIVCREKNSAVAPVACISLTDRLTLL
jgi:hypothetical protein